MNAHGNKQIVLAAYAALNSGDVAGYLAGLADDVEYTLFGSHRLARTFRGKQDLLENFLPVLVERLDGLIRFQMTNVMAEGDFVVVEAQGEARTKDGVDYNNTYCFVLKLKDGKAIEIREYTDTDLTRRIFG